MLTDTKLRNLKPKEKLYKVNDRDGLYVAVTPAGSVSFRYNYAINGRQETVTFGRYGIGGITLAETRERLGEAKRMVTVVSPQLKKKPEIKRELKVLKHLVHGLKSGFVAIKWQILHGICGDQFIPGNSRANLATKN